MSVFSGPEIINDNLVFHYDIANTQKSWKGAPTTNLLPQPLSFSTGYTQESWTTGSIADNNVLAPDGTLTASTILRVSGYLYKRNTISPTFIISAGQIITFSCWVKKLDNTPQVDRGLYIWCYNGAGSGNRASATQPIYNDSWVRQSVTYTALAGETDFSFGFVGSSSNHLQGSIAIWRPQVEISNFATPFINGTRSATQALLDLTNNNTLTATSLTYASDGTFSFDGTSDRIITSSNIIYGNNTTWEAWMNCSQSTNTYNMFMGRYLPYFGFYTGDGLIFSNSIGGSQQTVYKYGGLSLNTWYHTVFTTSYDGSNTTASIYVNGVLVSSAIQTGAQGNGIYQFVVGDGQSTAWFPFKGKVNNVNVYNRALLASEVQQNFNATRSRFGV